MTIASIPSKCSSFIAAFALSMGAVNVAQASSVSISGSTLVFTAAANEANRVTITYLPGSSGQPGLFVVKDAQRTLSAGAGCTWMLTDESWCYSPTALTGINVSLGDQSDTFHTPPSAAYPNPLPATIQVAVTGGSGDDTILLGPGNDWAHGESGNDTIKGEGGNDVIVGGDDNDVLNGGPGNDFLGGEAGADRLSGNAGNDTLDGGSGTDTFAEIIVGVPGLFYDPGDDTFVAYDGSDGDRAEHINCGPGNDTLRRSASDTWAACETVLP